MRAHQLPSIKKKPKRVGRGGKRGTTAGRGTKGQKSRAGRNIRPAERDLILKIPKLRGFANKPKSANAVVLNVGPLSEQLKKEGREKGITVDREFLKAAGLLSTRSRRSVKILAAGDIVLPFNVKGLEVSQAAAEKIEKSGGTITK